MSGLGIRRLRPQALAVRTLAPHPGEGVSRKHLLDAAMAAARGLELRPALRLVLEKMTSCYGEQELGRGLMVWPSNAWLVDATGLAERTIRIAIGELVGLAVIEPVDSANRKRFARRDRSGKIVEAFGFNLAPLHARRHEFEGLIVERREIERLRAIQFDALTIERKGIESALHALDDLVLMQRYAETLATLVRSLPRRSSCDDPACAIDALRALRSQIEAFILKESGSAGMERRHKEANTSASTETGQGSNELCDAEVIAAACPAVSEFGEHISDMRDVRRVGEKLRGVIGASRDAWIEVAAGVGELRAAALVLYVLQIHADDVAAGRGMIKSPGGLFRALGRRLAAGQMKLAAELHGLRRRKQAQRIP